LHHFDIRASHLIQKPGEFVLALPAAYHCGFSHGFNVGEAVNLATDAWFPWGRLARLHDRRLQRPALFSVDALLLEVARQCSSGVYNVALISQELKFLIESETAARKRVQEQGVSQIILLSHSKIIACSICSEDCVLSHLFCSRCKIPATCLLHLEFTCQCDDLEQVSLCLHYSLEELQQLWHNVTHGQGNS